MIVYADTSALLKRVIVESESAALRRFLWDRDGAGDLLASSALTWVEVARSLRRAAVDDIGALAHVALSGIDELPLSPIVLDHARSVGPRSLRSLDAIHLASAIELGAAGVLTYDERLAAAVRSMQMQVFAPQD